MTLKLAQFCGDPKKISTKSSYPQKIFIFLKTPKNIEIQNFEPKKIARAYVCVKISEYPPLGLTPPPPPPSSKWYRIVLTSGLGPHPPGQKYLDLPLNLQCISLNALDTKFQHSGYVFNLRLCSPWFKPHQSLCVVSLGKILYLLLKYRFKPRKPSDMTEKLLTWMLNRINTNILKSFYNVLGQKMQNYIF